MTEKTTQTPNHRSLPEAGGRLGLKPSEFDPTVLVKTSSGEIKPFLLASEDQRDGKGNRLAYDIVMNSEGKPEVGDIKPADERAFTPEIQALMANDLANSREGMPALLRDKTPEDLAQMDRKLERELGRETAHSREEAVEDLGSEALDAVEIAEPVDTTGKYDNLFNPDRQFGPAEDAAVRTESDEERLTRERRASDQVDAAIKRAGRPEMN